MIALLFSKVTIQSGFNEVEFMVGGFPTEPDDLARCDEYQDFLDEIDDETSVSVHVDAYVCGNSETIRASPDEVAEISARTEAEPDFLSDQCDWVSETDFEIQMSLTQSYFNEDFEM